MVVNDDGNARHLATGQEGGDCPISSHARLPKCRVFGSVATGENQPDSDVDFLVDLEPGHTIFDLARFLGDLRELLGTE